MHQKKILGLKKSMHKKILNLKKSMHQKNLPRDPMEKKHLGILHFSFFLVAWKKWSQFSISKFEMWPTRISRIYGVSKPEVQEHISWKQKPPSYRLQVFSLFHCCCHFQGSCFPFSGIVPFSGICPFAGLCLSQGLLLFFHPPLCHFSPASLGLSLGPCTCHKPKLKIQVVILKKNHKQKQQSPQTNKPLAAVSVELVAWEVSSCFLVLPSPWPARRTKQTSEQVAAQMWYRFCITWCQNKKENRPCIEKNSLRPSICPAACAA